MSKYPRIDYKALNEELYPKKDREYVTTLFEINNVTYIVEIVSMGLVNFKITEHKDDKTR